MLGITTPRKRSVMPKEGSLLPAFWSLTRSDIAHTLGALLPTANPRVMPLPSLALQCFIGTRKISAPIITVRITPVAPFRTPSYVIKSYIGRTARGKTSGMNGKGSSSFRPMRAFFGKSDTSWRSVAALVTKAPIILRAARRSGDLLLHLKIGNICYATL